MAKTIKRFNELLQQTEYLYRVRPTRWIDDKSLCLKMDDAQTLKSVLHAVYKTWRRDPGMNIGSSHVFNLYSQDLDAIINIHDRL